MPKKRRDGPTACARPLGTGRPVPEEAVPASVAAALPGWWRYCPQIDCTDARACMGYTVPPFGCLVPTCVRLGVHP